LSAKDVWCDSDTCFNSVSVYDSLASYNESICLFDRKEMPNIKQINEE
jgi:hypothetical protein